MRQKNEYMRWKTEWWKSLPLNKIEKKMKRNKYSWIMEKAREFQKNIYFCFIDYAKAFDCVDHNKL